MSLKISPYRGHHIETCWGHWSRGTLIAHLSVWMWFLSLALLSEAAGEHMLTFKSLRPIRTNLHTG